MLSTSWNILLLFVFCSTVEGDGPIVQTSYGKILGSVLTTDEGNEYYAFLEIPFASPPIGNLRFKKPVPPKKWDGILNTTENTKICHQINRYNDLPPGAIQTEDCLYLNVYTPKNPDDVLETDGLPVLVWIYGGGFQSGDATFQSYGPQEFIDNNIVVVAMNYRVGPFGFLTTEDGGIPANLGFRDQNFAFQWIQSNIEAFGGDPSKVTISGESAGAVAVGYHILNKNSAGLFRAAILQSATAIASLSHQKWARYYAFEAAKTLDSEFSSNSSTELLEFLQNVPADALNNLTLSVSSERENGIGSHKDIIWAPVIEDERVEDAFITGFPHEDIKNGNLNKVPILLGFTSEEELSFINYDIAELSRKFDNNLELLVHNKFNISEENKTAAGAELRSIYTEGTFEETFGSVVKFLSDESHTTPPIRQADLESQYTDVYLYEFSYKGPLGFVRPAVEGIDPNAVGHAEELAYMWHTERELPKIPDGDRFIRKSLTKLWANFVQHLNPTPEKDDLLQNVTWPKVSSEDIEYLNINSTLEVRTNPKEYRKYEKIYDKYTVPPLINY